MPGCHIQPEQMFNLIFGYNDRWSEDLGGTKVGAGAWNVLTTAVPSGSVYVVQTVTFRNTTGARGNVYLRFYDGALYVVVGFGAAPAKNVPTVWNGGAVLKAGDQVNVYQASCLNGDVIEAGVWGYKMKVTQ